MRSPLGNSFDQGPVDSLTEDAAPCAGGHERPVQGAEDTIGEDSGRLLDPPRWNLRIYFGLILFVAAMLVIRQTFGTPIMLVTIAAAFAMLFHVIGTRIGTRLGHQTVKRLPRERIVPPPSTTERPNSVAAPAVHAATRDAVATGKFWPGRSAWRETAIVAGGCLFFGVTGLIVLIETSARTLHPFTAVVGGLAWAVIGGITTFGLVRCFAVIVDAYRDAQPNRHRHGSTRHS